MPIGQQPRLGDAPDWFVVNWQSIWKATGFTPSMLPGVRPLKGKQSERPPFPQYVHRTHFSVLGLSVPREGCFCGSPSPMFHDVACPLFESDIESICDHGITGCVTRGVHTEHFIPARLRPHQVVGVQYIRERRGTLLADEPRVGKSAQVVFAHEPEEGPLLLIGPAAARLTWHEWAARRYGYCTANPAETPCATCERVGALYHPDQPSFLALLHQKFDPEKVTQANAHVYFLTTALVPYWAELFAHLRLGTLAIDEAHLGLQKMTNATTLALMKLATVAKRVVACTGTPLYNRNKGLYPLLNLVNPAAWGDFRSFGQRYCGPVVNAYGTSYDGASNEEELRERLTEVMIRRTWPEIRQGLPTITRSIELVPLSDATLDKVQEQAAGLPEAPVRTFAARLARIRRLLSIVKVQSAVPWITEAVVAGRTVLAWTYHVDAAQQLADRLRERGLSVYGPVTSGVGPAAREAEIEACRSHAGPRVFIATMGTVAVGLSLNFADEALFVELDYVPVTIAQAEMRHFDGTKPVAVSYLVADCDSDRRLIDHILPKLENASQLGLDAGMGDPRAVLRAAFALPPELDLDDVAKLIAANADCY